MNAMETMLSAVADTFDAKALNALVEMRAPEDAAARMAWLAERENGVRVEWHCFKTDLGEKDGQKSASPVK